MENQPMWVNRVDLIHPSPEQFFVKMITSDQFSGDLHQELFRDSGAATGVLPFLYVRGTRPEKTAMAAYPLEILPACRATDHPGESVVFVARLGVLILCNAGQRLLSHIVRRLINDLEKAREEVSTETIVLRKENDLFIRDAITGLGTILKEAPEDHYYIKTVRTGLFGNVLTQAIILRNGMEATFAVYAHEGLIKQHLAEKTLQRLRQVLC